MVTAAFFACLGLMQVVTGTTRPKSGDRHQERGWLVNVLVVPGVLAGAMFLAGIRAMNKGSKP